MRVSYITLVSDSGEYEEMFRRDELDVKLEGDVLNGFNFVMRKWVRIVTILSTSRETSTVNRKRLPVVIRNINLKDLIGKVKLVLHHNVPVKGLFMGRTGYIVFDQQYTFGIKSENYVNYINEWIEIGRNMDKLLKINRKYINRRNAFLEMKKYSDAEEHKKFVTIFDGDVELVYIDNVKDFIRGISTYYQFTGLPYVFPNVYKVKRYFYSIHDVKEADVAKGRIVPISFKLNGRMVESKEFPIRPEEDDESSDESSYESSYESPYDTV